MGVDALASGWDGVWGCLLMDADQLGGDHCAVCRVSWGNGDAKWCCSRVLGGDMTVADRVFFITIPLSAALFGFMGLWPGWLWRVLMGWLLVEDRLMIA